MKRPPHPEDEYFAKVDLINLKRLADNKRMKMHEQEVHHLRELHANHCPSCGFEMDSVLFKGFPIHRCFHCGGTFLEQGTLAALSGEESHIIDRLVELFRF